MVDTTSKEEGIKIPNIDVKEIGNTGLVHFNGVVGEECNKELRYPYAVTTYKKMLKDPVIAPSVELIENKIAGVPWRVVIPDGKEDELRDKADKLEQILFNDMETPFETFIRQAATFNSFGFSVVEKVFRYRNKEYGSKYDDGYVGIRKLAFRSQDTIARWEFDKNNKELKGFWQYSNRNNNPHSLDFYDSVIRDYDVTNGFRGNDTVFIPKNKFLHFVNNPHKDSPTGTSPLNAAHTPWKYKQAYLQVEAKGVAKEAHGIKTLYLPPDYMADDAPQELKDAYRMYQQVMLSMDKGDSSSIILPILTDGMGNKMFELTVENLTGTSSYNINHIIERFNNEIFTCLFASVLPLGSSGGGSHALSESKMDIVTEMVKSKLNTIKSVINHDLIPHVFKLNGWDTEVLPYLDYGDIERSDLQAFSAAIQRIKAVGLLPRTPEVVNWILRELGSPARVPFNATQEELDEMLGESTSRSGDSFNTPSGGLYGTGHEVDSDDNTISNKENK